MKTQIKDPFTGLGKAWRAAWVLPAVIVCLGLAPGGTVRAQMTTAFMYHGVLDDQNGNPVTGLYDFKFTIYDQLTSGLVKGGPLSTTGTGVTNGLFTAQLDFGSTPFSEDLRWLEIAVSPHNANSFSTLSPRQQFTATPYAIRAANFSGTVIASQLAAGAAAQNLGSSGQSGVASGGAVLSTDGNNTSLTAAGYVKIGSTLTTQEIWKFANSSGSPTASGSAVWTGSEMIVWGGSKNVSPYFANDGAIYDPVADNWTAMNSSGAPSARTGHTAVWANGKMIVWGGTSGFGGSTVYYNDGGVYDPSGGGSWTPIPNSLPNTPAARNGHTALWTGSKMIIWGGWNGSFGFNDGGIYDPAGGGTWAVVNLTGAPAARVGQFGVDISSTSLITMVESMIPQPTVALGVGQR